jgi:prepilin-type N-terminal cleavage/methylation domain-containing protein
MVKIKTKAGRQGFTLVELLVAMTVTMFIMVILTQAFVIAVDTFSGLKGIGDMQENLRAGANQLRFDLAQAHFEGMRRTSDAIPSSGAAAFSQQPPREGFLAFNAAAAVPPGLIQEGTDPDGMPSTRAISQILGFTSRLKGNQQQSFYSAWIGPNSTAQFFNATTFYNLPPPGADDATLNPRNPAAQPQFYRSQWAAIVYFLGNNPNGALQPTGSTEEPMNPNSAIPGSTPLYGLYRAQFVAVTDKTQLVGQIPDANKNDFAGMACLSNGVTIDFYTPNDLATIRNLNNPNVVLRNASLVVPNVISFQVQGIAQGAAAPADMNYDSASTPQTPLIGLAITIRVWDNKTRQTRQLTVVQDL